MRRKSKAIRIVRMNLAPVDEIMTRVRRLDAAQRFHLDARIFSLPGLFRSCLSVWAFRHRDSLKRELPKGPRTAVFGVWRTIEACCRRDRRPRRKAKNGR